MTAWDTLDDTISNFAQESKNRQRRTPFGFSLKAKGAPNAKPGEEKGEFVILDDSNLFIRFEHPYYFNKQNFGTIPCLATSDLSVCPACNYAAMNPKSAIKARTLFAYLTIVQIGEFTFDTNAGPKTIKNPVRALIMKTGSLEKLKLIREENDNNLTGLHIRASRSADDKSPSVGDNWLPKRDRLTTEQILALNSDAKSYVWDEVLPVMTPNEVKAKLAMLTGQHVAEPVARQGDAPVTW